MSARLNADITPRRERHDRRILEELLGEVETRGEAERAGLQLTRLNSYNGAGESHRESYS